MLNKKKKGFTLIELIVVMAIIAILVLLAAPKYLNYTKDAHVTAMQQDAKVLSNIALTHNVKNDGAWPVGTELADDAALALLGTVTLTQINEALSGADIAVTDLAPFSTDAEDSLQGLKNPIADYVLVINGENEGEVVYVEKVLENSDGDKFITVSAMPEVVTP